jgi:hypothetical protein
VITFACATASHRLMPAIDGIDRAVDEDTRIANRPNAAAGEPDKRFVTFANDSD